MGGTGRNEPRNMYACHMDTEKVVNEARGERAGWRRAKQGKWWTSLVVSTIKKIILFMKEKEYVKNV